MPQDLFASPDPLNLSILLINLGIGTILAIILRWHFRTYGSTLSNREEFSQVFPFILLTTILIITVVKSSLALSLGLVGALSIVRFRTPIKEPEELAYLFVAIAMGLGLGANQTLPTAVAGLSILAIMAMLGRYRKENNSKGIYLSLDIDDFEDNSEDIISDLVIVISKHAKAPDLRRFDLRGNMFEATFYLDVLSSANLSHLSKELRGSYPTIGLTFLDQNQMPAI